VYGIRLALLIGVPPETCPLCGTPVTLVRSTTSRPETDSLRDRIATLRQRADDLEQGDLTPRQLKDELLWMCADCQRVMTDLSRLDRQEIQRRIHEQVRQLERRRARRVRRAG
jgi:transcription initiation factor IIE alpha subunit